jgi:hypothetical protein
LEKKLENHQKENAAEAQVNLIAEKQKYKNVSSDYVT